MDTDEAVLVSEASLISVGTPSAPDGSPDLAAVEAVVCAFGEGAEFAIVGHASNCEMCTIAAPHVGNFIIDLQGVRELEEIDGMDYEGVCW